MASIGLVPHPLESSIDWLVRLVAALVACNPWTFDDQTIDRRLDPFQTHVAGWPNGVLEVGDSGPAVTLFLLLLQSPDLAAAACNSVLSRRLPVVGWRGGRVPCLWDGRRAWPRGPTGPSGSPPAWKQARGGTPTTPQSPQARLATAAPRLPQLRRLSRLSIPLCFDPRLLSVIPSSSNLQELDCHLRR